MTGIPVANLYLWDSNQSDVARTPSVSFIPVEVSPAVQVKSVRKNWML
jgi:hypothetical protein